MAKEKIIKICELAITKDLKKRTKLIIIAEAILRLTDMLSDLRKNTLLKAERLLGK